MLEPMTDPLSLTDTVLHLDGVGPVTLARNDPEYWAGKNRPDGTSGAMPQRASPYNLRPCQRDG